MDALRAYIERISRDTIAQSATVIAEDQVLVDFFEDPSPGALFVVESQEVLHVRATLDAPGTVLALVKQGPINPETPIPSQIFPIAIPNGETSESLHAVVHYVLAPYFEASTSAGVAKASANIAAARQKIAELELSFYNLQFHTEIQLLDLVSPPLPTEEDQADLNALQNTVNEWKKSIRSVVRVARDPSVGSATEEVLFWHSMENALIHIEQQLKLPKVTRTIELLELGKRFHATVSFPGDTGLPETLALVQKYNIVLRDLPLNDLIVATTFQTVSTAIDNIFGHIFKKLRPSAYPVWRALALVEAISADFARSLRELFMKQAILSLDERQFSTVMGQARTLFIQWDDHIREFTNIARDVIRKRSEKFIPVRINGKHIDIKNRINYLNDFRTRHDQLISSLSTVEGHLGDLQLISKIRAEFLRIAAIDVLDTSPEGVSKWDTLEASYNAVAGSIEAEVAKLLRSRLSNAQDSHEMFRIFGDFNSLFTRPAIRGAIHEYQARLLEVVKSDISELQTRVSKQYIHSYAFKSASLNDIPSISGLVIWLRQITSRLNKLLERVTDVLGPEWQNYADGKKLYTECIGFTEKIDPLPIVNNWIRSIAQKQFDLSDTIFVIKRGEIAVNFDTEMGTLFKELRALSSFGFHVPHTFIATAQSSKQLYPFAVRLIEDLKVFYDCLKRVESDDAAKQVVQKELNDVLVLLIDGANSSWKALNSIENQSKYVEMLDNAVMSLESHVDNTMASIVFIRKCILELVDCEYSRDTFEDVISRINQRIEKVTSGRGSEFGKKISKQVSQQLTARCIEELDSWHLKKTPCHHNLTLSNQVIVIMPPLNKASESLFGEVNDIVKQITCSEISEPVWAATGKAIGSITESINDAQAYLENWYGFQGLWDLKGETVWNTLGRDLDYWQQVLYDLHESRKTLDDDSEQQSFGRITVNFSQIHAYVHSKYDIWQNDMVLKFSTLVAEKSSEILGKIRNIRQEHEEISFLTGSTDLLAKYLDTVKCTASNIGTIESEIRSLDKSQAALSRYRFQFPKRWVYFDQILGEWRSLHELHTSRAAELENIRPRLISEIEGSILRLKSKVETLFSQWQSSKPVSGSIKPEDAMFAVERFDDEVKKAIKQRDVFQRCCELVDIDFTFPLPLDDMAAEIVDFASAWQAISGTWSSLQALENTPWSIMQTRKVRSSLSQLLDQTQEMPSRIRQYVAFQHVQNIIRDRIKSISVLSNLRSEAINQRHWDKITVALDIPPLNLASMTLGDVWDIGIMSRKAILEEYITVAQGEHRIDVSIQEINMFWSTFTVELVSYQNKVRLIKNWDEIFSKADEHLQLLDTMQKSPYFKVFSQLAFEWETKLNKLRTLFDNWVDVQRQWVYLEGVFSGKDIRHVLSLEFAKFGTINSELFAIFKMVAKNPNALEISSIPGIGESMKRMGDLLLKLQRALSNYFEQERKQFGRYYFVGDDDVLEMIGNFKAERVEKHLKKMFAGVARLSLNEDSTSIEGVVSHEDELLMFRHQISTDDSMINVLRQVEQNMSMAIRYEIETAFSSINSFLDQGDVSWLDRPSQAALVALRLYWTRECESSMKRSEISDILDKSLILLATETLKDLDLLARRRIEIILTEMVHLNDLTKSSDLDWDMQMRYYIDKKANVQVRQAGAQFDYGYEYQGAPSLLVNTPLIDRMFLTMTQALDQRYGGSPFGPAGTGKTESVKALGQALGMFVVVFCCDETFDFQAITRLLAGICQTGAWACFDEFNRLESNTLSSVSTHVATVEYALRENKTQVELGDRSGLLNPKTALFVTMNPNYIGRHTLPDNMKNLFRSFAMKNPDMENIVAVILYSQGFEHAKMIAQKLVPFFANLKSQTSAQTHYDWGLRAIKGVMRVCGSMKRQFKVDTYQGELGIIKLACREILTPKLVAADQDVFTAAEQLFDGADSMELKTDDLDFASLGTLVADPEWVTKVRQLHRFLDLHHSVMLVGATSTGKTSTWKTLARLVPQEVEVYQMDPKTVSKEHLYGSLDLTTREWSDGIFTGILRKITENLRGEDKRTHWIVFDGDIDPNWAENLNSVLDDNKILTLPSGERIPLPGNLKIIFEASTLESATPATVSRCAMVWFDQHILSIETIMRHHYLSLKDRFDDEKDLKSLDMVQDALKKVDFTEVFKFASGIDHIMPFSAARALTTLWSFIESRIPQNSGNMDFIVNLVYSATVWAFAGDCKTDDRDNFCAWFEGTSGKKQILQYDVSPISGQWVPWQDSVTELDIEPHDVIDSNLVIPTIDTVRHEALIYQLLSVHQPVILCGPPGVGKTMTLLSSLRRSEVFDLVTLNFSKTTSANMVINSLEQKCKYKMTPGGLVMEPTHMGQWIVLFCDEINLPGQDQYGTQKVISLLREIVQRKGFYKGTQWVQTRRIQFVGACNPPTDVGRIPLNERFLRLCSLVYVDNPSGSSLKHIYQTMCSGLLKSIPELRNNADLLSEAMISVYEQSRDRFQGAMAHYIYSPRELTRWTKGIYAAINDKFSMNLDELVRVWAHEGLRLFSDKLATEIERDWTFELIRNTAASLFHTSESALQTPILFSDWLNKEYTSVGRTEMIEFLNARMRVFNEEVAEKRLTLFNDMIDHILRIDRVLRQPQGHMILMGSSSSGKTTLTKFVCWMNGINVFQIQSSNNYTEQDFVSDLRSVLKQAGCEGLKTCFILDESNLWDSSFLEKMNTLLANSEVPGLFENEEYTTLLADCRKGSSKQGLNLVDEDDLITWFTRQITSNLHVVFTINSPENVILSHTATSPALFNRCVLNWMGTWSDDALSQVSTDQINMLDTGTIAKDAITSYLVSAFKLISGKDSPSREMTPGEFLAHVYQFSKIFKSKRESLEEEQLHCNVGIDKLKGTMLEVKQLRQELAEKQVELEQKDAESRKMLQQMLTDQSEAERKKEAGINIRAAIEAQNQEIETRKEIVYQDLALAEPAVLEAQNGVKDIKKQHLNELRAFTNPPEPVKITLEAVCFVFGLKHSTWREVLQAVRGEDFIPGIVCFDNEQQMTPEVLHVLQNNYMKRPNFTFAAVDRASKACGPLQKWITAQVAYATVLQKVDPLRQEVLELEQTAQEKAAQEHAINEMLQELEASIEDYKVSYAQLIADTQQIKMEMKNVQSKLDASVHLVANLDTEKQRWIESVAGFEERTKKLVGDCLLASGFLVYCGFFDQKLRETIVYEWESLLDYNGISRTNGLNIVAFMSTSAERLQWNSHGLEADNLSMENNIMLKEYYKFPFIIDPTNKIQGYLRSAENTTITSFLDGSFKKHVESALRFGTSVVICNAEKFDPVIMPLLNQEYSKRGGRTVIDFDGHEIDVSRDYKLFLVTNDTNIKLLPHISSRTTVVNFSITPNSLERIVLDGLLGKTKPDLEKQRHELINLQGEYRVQLHQLEVQLLSALNETQGNVLDNKELVSTLETIKTKADDTKKKAGVAKQAMVDIETTTQEYMPVAATSTHLHSLVDNLCKILKSYQFSFSYFLSIFQSVLNARDFSTVEEFNKMLYLEVFSQYSPALLHKDRASFALALLELFDGSSLPFEGDLSEINHRFSNIGPIDIMAEDDWHKLILDSKVTMFMVKDFDPSLRLRSAAEKAGAKCEVIALGSHEGELSAEAAIGVAIRLGHWLVIQNIHMAPQWMSTLQNQLKKVSKAHPDCRIIMTTQLDNPNVPSSILQVSKLISVERPVGIKAGMRENLAMIDGSLRNPPAERTRIYLAVAWTHAVIQERQRLGKVGWSGFYDFSDFDLTFAINILDKQLSVYKQRSNVDPETFKWAHIRDLLVKTVYGAKVDSLSDGAIISQLFDNALQSRLFDNKYQLSIGCPGTAIPDSLEPDAIDSWLHSLPDEEPPLWLGLADSDQTAYLQQAMASINSNTNKLL